MSEQKVLLGSRESLRAVNWQMLCLQGLICDLGNKQKRCRIVL